MIRQIVLKNWQAFRGEHVIDLEPKAYAIVAKYDSDPGRSNWAGKSALLEAIEFALTGYLNKDRRFDADGWLTRGEKDGKVSVVLDDGSSITRTRKFGQATQVRCTIVGNGEASQSEAESRMLKYLAFGEKDFRNVAYFAQGTMAKLIRTEPEKRFEIIRGWLNLEKAEEAEEKSSDLVKHHIREVQRLKQKLEMTTSLLDGLPASEANVEELKTKQASLDKKLVKLNAEKSKLSQRRSMEETVERFKSLIEQGKLVDAEIALYPADFEEQKGKAVATYEAANNALSAAAADLASKKRVARGEFDGQCPVADLQCPAQTIINADRLKSKQALDKAEKKFKEKQQAFNDAKQDVDKFGNMVRDLIKKKARRDQAREQAANLRDEVLEAKASLKAFGELRSSEDIDHDIVETNTRIREIANIIVAEQHNEQHRDRLQRDQKQLVKEIDNHTKEAAVATQTRSVFRATQRRLAERALNAINQRSNSLLNNANVDLSVDIKWEHEGKDYAKSCEMCGMAFPSSAKVKQCETCGAERGRNIIQRLDFLLSDRSGAADDFAGIALQLSAGSWLLSSRESPWATAMIDEPFSQMDKTVRRAAAKQLLTLLGASAFRQVFVISHSEDTVSMYPAHINITVAKDGTRSITTT